MANPQIENGHIDIANEIADKLCSYRLSGEEWQVLWVILRKTYGWHKKEDWISLSQFVSLTGIKKPDIIKVLKKLLSKNIIFISKKDNAVIQMDNAKINYYAFNKDYDTWKPLSKRITLSKKITTVIQMDNLALSKWIPTKETITKENITKENRDSSLKNEKQEISLKDEKQEKAKELIIQFCALREIPLDSGFFSKNIRSARSLVGYYPVELILAGIAWRLKNDPDNFWTQKLWSLNSVYSHFAEWIAQSKLKTEKTFTDWLIRNTEQDYRAIVEPDAKVKAFFVSFNRALKDGICPTPEEWGKYQKARELNNESLQRS